MSDFFECPHCGADVPQGALACPACGSDEETGWSDAARFGDLPPYDADPAGEERGWRAWTQALVALVAAALLAVTLSQSLPIGLALSIPILFLAAAIAYIINRWAGSRSGPSQERLYQSLLRMAMGDEALAERLIDYEAQRSISADRRQHIQDAIDRWLRDAR